MSTEAILTDEIIFALAAETDIASIDPKVDVLMFSRDEMLQAGRAIEQAVLQSPEIQALRKDAGRFRKIASHIYEIKRTHKRGGDNKVRRLQLDIRNHTPSPAKWLEEAVDDLDAAMEKQP